MILVADISTASIGVATPLEKGRGEGGRGERGRGEREGREKERGEREKERGEREKGERGRGERGRRERERKERREGGSREREIERERRESLCLLESSHPPLPALQLLDPLKKSTCKNENHS